MAVRLRLQRHGKKGKPVYTIVAADSRAKRDGKFIEKLGQYNPNLSFQNVTLDFEKALKWIQVGAEPSDTVRNILSREGVLYKNHLLKGVTKGALTLEQAEAKFQTWLQDREQKIGNKLAGARKAKDDAEAKRKATELAQADEKIKAAEAALQAEQTEAVAEEVAATEEGSVKDAPATEEENKEAAE
jgi:small subunit ribosomal protein S16